MTSDGDIHLAAQRRSRNLNFMAARPPLTATERIRRIGWLENGRVDDPAVQARTASAKQELEKLGWGFGRNVAIDQRWGVTSFETAQQLGAELLGLAPDVVLCAGAKKRIAAETFHAALRR
jgi:hypothetical protein